jgi:hypothetical protein
LLLLLQLMMMVRVSRLNFAKAEGDLSLWLSANCCIAVIGYQAKDVIKNR